MSAQGMTTPPNALVATVNHERMPVLLTQPEEFDRWMHGSPQAALELARQYPPEQMQIVQTGYDKEDALVLAVTKGLGTVSRKLL